MDGEKTTNTQEKETEARREITGIRKPLSLRDMYGETRLTS